MSPLLFIPGSPITIVGGLLFGPVWGVVYTITGATMGASLAFLVSRHFARDLVAGRLTGEKFRKLDEAVEKNGWKVVAVTRLLPIFPFNVLNYALGLTRIGFAAYVVTSFVCMLPATIAFVVFSSSLPDLLKGKASPLLLAGIALLALAAALPFLVRKFTSKGVREL